ncbi:MAG: ECF-type sigma factor [Candidatus Eisenbacteria bacterium]
MTDGQDSDASDRVPPFRDPPSAGEEPASRRLFGLVYEELRTIARKQLADEATGHSLRPTELVHEAYLRLSRAHGIIWTDRTQFYATVAQAMRRLLIEHARKRKRIKRGGGLRPLPLDDAQVPVDGDLEELIALDDALRRLREIDPRAADTFELRVFAGLSIEEVGATLETSPATVKRDFGVARAWLVCAVEVSTRGLGSEGGSDGA